MSYLALYRRYRPKTFSELIGQEHIVRTLTNQIEANKVGHAYLFTGTRGTGKTSTAKMFAVAINCENPINGSPCGKCKTCIELQNQNNLDIIEMDAASNNGVEEIRSLREKVGYPPTIGKYKVYIIDEVHMLSTQAFNALLKTLEEPPKHAVFILATTEVHKVPATILSRCMRFDFKLIPTESIANLIKSIYNEQGKEYEEEAVNYIAKAGEGSVRDALSIADTCLSFTKSKLTYDDVLNVLGTTDYLSVLKIVEYIITSDSQKLLKEVESLLALGKQVSVLLSNINSVIRDLLIVKTCTDANTILQMPKDRFKVLEEIAQNTSGERLLRCLEILTKLDNDMRYTTNQKIVFETAIMLCARPEADYNIDALLARIKSLEDKLMGAKIEKQEDVESNIKKNFSTTDIKTIMSDLLKRLRATNNQMISELVKDAHGEKDENCLYLNLQDASSVEMLGETQLATMKSLFSDYTPFEIKAVCKITKEMEKDYDRAVEELIETFGIENVITKK